ncbi:Carrier protein YMC1 [Yarrowia sp. C11]|nr:Carrier protein YMC1 [Yarrowia sp. C11]
MSDDSITRKLKDITAGFVGGAAQVLIGQPFDLVKVRIQTGQYKTPLEAFTKTLATEGPLAFYRGTSGPLFGVGACVSIQFYTFHEAKRFFLRLDGKKSDNVFDLTYPQIYLAGASAGVVNTIVASPIEQLRILAQTTKSTTHQGVVGMFKQVYGNYGLKGIYRGAGVTLLREAQGYGMWFLSFEFLIKQVCERTNTERKNLPAWQLLSCGALAGQVLWLSCYPLDVIKSKVQSDSFTHPKYKGALDALRQTLKTDRVSGLFRGLSPTLLRAIPASAGTFAAVEMTMRLLG